MATIKELADAEAERAEAETADDDTEPEPDTEAEPDDGDTDPDGEPEPDTEAEPEMVRNVDRVLAELDRVGDDYTTHVQALSAEGQLGLVECPLCPVPGFVPDQPMPDVDPGQRMAVLTVLGEGAAAVSPPHPNLHRCEGCDGYGLLDTGSRREAFATAPCPSCGGNGYIDQAVLQAQADARLQSGIPGGFDQVPAPAPDNNVIPTPTVTQGGHTFPVVLGGALDQHGRMAGHPLWGQPYEAGGL